jgi:hypothetical protein
MADEPTPEPEVIITGSREERYYAINRILSQNFLKSAKFSVRLYRNELSIKRNDAVIANFEEIKAKNLSFLCDSVEFPGQSLTASEYRIPGKLKLKIPYLREQNEITLTFYHNDESPLYSYFTNWIQNISPTNTTNAYFNEIVAPKMDIVQFDEVAGIRGFIIDQFGFNSTPVGGASANLRKYMTVSLKNIYPLSFSSMPSNWADDGFHKMTVTFFYETINIEMGINGN